MGRSGPENGGGQGVGVRVCGGVWAGSTVMQPTGRHRNANCITIAGSRGRGTVKLLGQPHEHQLRVPVQLDCALHAP